MRLNMLFWPLTTLSLVSLSLVLLGPPGSAFLWSDDLELRAAYFVVFGAGITIASAGRMLIRGGARTGRYAAIWIGVFSGLVTAYAYRVELSHSYDLMRGTIHPSVALSTAKGEAQLRRAWDGHYRAEAEVNGERMRLMVDTGASMVLLPYEAMEQIGIDADRLEFTLPITTANGQSSVAPIRLASIRIGPIEVRDVQAAVAHPGRLKSGLLGMSFLDRLYETSFRGDKLILKMQ
ncbi:MAG: TIGR02281 family clan AA aspartic protease [Pseudomonadota bacterium]